MTHEPGNTGGATRGRGLDAAAAVRASRALDLRMGGATYDQIAESLGYSSRAAAHRAVSRSLRRDDERIADLRDEYRRLQLARTERLTLALWPQAVRGNVAATDRVLRLMERQARLLGLDAPAHVAMTVEQRSEALDVIADIERYLAQMAGVPSEGP